MTGPAGVVVRPARAEDHDAWSALFDEVAAEGRWIGAEAPLHPGWARRSFDRALAGDRAGLLLAERAGARADGTDAGETTGGGPGSVEREADALLVGHIGLSLDGGRVEIGMVVRAGHRRQGIGSALVAAGIDWARAHDAHKVALSVWPHNTAAIALYERHGFVVEGRLARHVRRRDGSLWDLVAAGLVLDTTAPGGPLD